MEPLRLLGEALLAASKFPHLHRLVDRVENLLFGADGILMQV